MTPEEHADNICHWRTPALRDRVVQEIKNAVEECAKIAYGYWVTGKAPESHYQKIADSIRAGKVLP